MENNQKQIVIKNIKKAFPGVLALNNVDFDVKKGEVHALVGENGAGKSTLIKILAGFYSKDSGEIIFDGKNIELKNPRNAIELGISTIYQEIMAVPYITVAENILLENRPKNKFGLIDWKKIKRKVNGILDKYSIELKTDEILSNLSASQQKMAEIAKALSFEAKLLIMDEPTASLTEKETVKLFDTIKKIKSKGISVIYISHRLEEVFDIADRITVLRDGKKIITKEVKDTNKDEVIRYMVGRELDEMYGIKKGSNEKKIALKVENFSDLHNFKNVSFDLYEGEILGFAGLTGAGRSELLKAIFGISYKSSGKLYWKGKEVEIKSPIDAIRMGMGFVPEDRRTEALFLDLDVIKNITACSFNRIGKYNVISKGLEKAIADKFIKKLSIKCATPSQEIQFLSGGNQQKAVISRWLAINPKLLILDEPTTGIDVGSKSDLHKLITNITSQGTSVILISSEMPEILKMSDRIVVMREGKIQKIIQRKSASEETLLKYMSGWEE